MHRSPSYLGVFLTFARNSLVRDMTFRANFIIDTISSISWMVMNLGFYTLVYRNTSHISDWGKYEFFVFISTTMFVNSIVQAFFMPNAEELSEQVRTGGLDTQFLVSLRKVSWSSLGIFFVALILLAYSVPRIEGFTPTIWQFILYPLYVIMGVLILYSVMIALAATSIWLGRNQSLYDFWFYITNFSRYPMEIYDGPWGTPIRQIFTFVVPILVVINVPARLMAKPLSPENAGMAVFGLLATAASVLGSRWIFNRALVSYRSASS
jgi:ABC-2 type transport system permease protein